MWSGIGVIHVDDFLRIIFLVEGKDGHVLLVLPLEGDDGAGEKPELDPDLLVADFLDVCVFSKFFI